MMRVIREQDCVDKMSSRADKPGQDVKAEDTDTTTEHTEFK